MTQKAMFLFGGRGIMTGNPAEKLVRDALTLTHGNGTSALMTLRIGEQQARARLAVGPEESPHEPLRCLRVRSSAPLIGEIHGRPAGNDVPRFTWRILSNYVTPWEFEQLRRRSPTTSSGAPPGARTPRGT